MFIFVLLIGMVSCVSYECDWYYPFRAVARSGRRRLLVGVQGDSPLLKREVSSLHPSFPPPQAAKREFATALIILSVASQTLDDYCIV